MSTAKEVKTFQKVQKGIKDGKLLNISTGREIDASGKTAKDKFVNVNLKIAANTQAEIEDFMTKYTAFTGGGSLKKVPSPRASPKKVPSPRASPKGSPKIPSPPKIKKVKSPIRVVKMTGAVPLPGYSKPGKCGPKNAYICPDEKICNVNTGKCVNTIRGKGKSIADLVNAQGQKVKVSGTTDALTKAIAEIEKSITVKSPVKVVSPPKKKKAVVEEQPAVNITTTSPPVLTVKKRKSSPRKASPRKASPPKAPKAKKATPPSSPRRKTPSPVALPKAIEPIDMVPRTPPRSPVSSPKRKSDTMAELVSVLSQISKPPVSDATRKKKRTSQPKDAESAPIPSRQLPSGRALTLALNNRAARVYVRQCLGIPV